MYAVYEISCPLPLHFSTRPNYVLSTLYTYMGLHVQYRLENINYAHEIAENALLYSNIVMITIIMFSSLLYSW